MFTVAATTTITPDGRVRKQLIQAPGEMPTFDDAVEALEKLYDEAPKSKRPGVGLALDTLYGIIMRAIDGAKIVDLVP